MLELNFEKADGLGISKNYDQVGCGVTKLS